MQRHAVNPERLRQHQEHKARLARVYAPLPRSAPVSAVWLGSPPLQRDAHVYAWRGSRPQIMLTDVVGAVSRATGAEVTAILSRSKQQETVLARWIAMYVLATDTRRSLPQVGRLMDRDHTSVLCARRKVASLVAKDERVRDIVQAVRRELGLATISCRQEAERTLEHRQAGQE